MLLVDTRTSLLASGLCSCFRKLQAKSKEAEAKQAESAPAPAAKGKGKGKVVDEAAAAEKLKKSQDCELVLFDFSI